jgi:hypothetical protein
VAEVAAAMESAGARMLSEREISAREREEGARHLSAELGPRRFHRADLLRIRDDGAPEAIEVELSAKGAARLEEILRAWRRAVGERRLSRVTYLCAGRTRSMLERAVERTATQPAISVREL